MLCIEEMVTSNGLPSLFFQYCFSPLQMISEPINPHRKDLSEIWWWNEDATVANLDSDLSSCSEAAYFTISRPN